MALNMEYSILINLTQNYNEKILNSNYRIMYNNSHFCYMLTFVLIFCNK